MTDELPTGARDYLQYTTDCMLALGAADYFLKDPANQRRAAVDASALPDYLSAWKLYNGSRTLVLDPFDTLAADTQSAQFKAAHASFWQTYERKGGRYRIKKRVLRALVARADRCAAQKTAAMTRATHIAAYGKGIECLAVAQPLYAGIQQNASYGLPIGVDAAEAEALLRHALARTNAAATSLAVDRDRRDRDLQRRYRLLWSPLDLAGEQELDEETVAQQRSDRLVAALARCRSDRRWTDAAARAVESVRGDR
ncbi:MAG: hypothetical protein AAF648_05500 [Pseudomonadota bacterium]